MIKTEDFKSEEAKVVGLFSDSFLHLSQTDTHTAGAYPGFVPVMENLESHGIL